MKKLLVLVFAIALCLGALCVGASAAEYDQNGFGNDGSYEPATQQNGVYQISNAGQLYWFAQQVNSGSTGISAVLTADITINENVLNENGKLNSGTFREWTPIGTDYEKAYTGTFDGDDHTISGLYYSDTNGYCGLFGYVGNGGQVKNVKVDDSYINDTVYVGGVCGYNYGGTITNCSFDGSVTSTFRMSYVGGVCGISSGSIIDCYNTGSVTGISVVGGVCGRNAGTITNCYNSGTITGTSENVGGVCGGNEGGAITNCYNSGTITGTSENVGGVCGRNDGTITNCYNTGDVTGTGNGTGTLYVGGVSGYNYFATIENCYNIGKVSGNSAGGVCGHNYFGTITNCYNMGNVSGGGNNDNVGGVCGCNDNRSTITNCYWREVSGLNGWGINNGTVTNVEPKTNDQFTSGEVAWLLNGEEQMNGPWRQNLGDKKDAFPVLDDGKPKVHYNGNTYDNGNHTYSEGSNGFCTCGAYQPATLDGGVYQIGNAGQLYWFAQTVNEGDYDAHAVLTDNITINSDVLDENGNLITDKTFTRWTPICGKEIRPYDYTEYTGTFDGDGHTISGLYYNDDGDYAGLFGYVGSNGRVQNVKVADSYISNSERTGRTGGVCGYNGGTITNCYNTGTVKGSYYTGGVCAASSGMIMNSYNSGTVTSVGSNTCVGGVCGYNYRGSAIRNCYNTGAVNGENTGNGNFYAGGVCGRNSDGATINCYNTGSVTLTGTGTNYAGGVCGRNTDGTITNCYWLTGKASSGIGTGSGTATEKTEAQFASGEVAWLLNSNQENGPWRQTLDEDDYPVLDSTHEEVVKLTVDSTVSYLNKGDSFSGVEGIGYYLDGEMVELPYTVEADTVLTTKTLYVVTVDGVVSYVDPNEPVFKLPAAPSKSGYYFVGWSDGNKTYDPGDSVTITADTTFTAAWKQLFTVTVVYDNGTADTIEQVVDGDTFKLPAAPSKSGYYFVGWSDGSKTYEAGESVTVTADTTFTAVWREINIPDPNSIAVTQPANGTIRVNPSNGSAGTLITVTATPDEGYELAYITVDGEKITGNTFRMPDKSVTVSAVFVPATFPFVDVKSGDWLYDYVAYVYSNGLMDGTSATTFEPNANMTRAMVWAILARIDGETVTGANWVETAREWAMASGVSDGENADGYVTREQLATMLWRYAGEPASDYSLSAFTDADSVSDYAATAMAWAVEHGIITGVTDSTLAPQGTATRAQCAAMLMRFVENVK